MPMDNRIDKTTLYNDYGLNRVFGWKLKVCLTPKKCFLTQKPLWGKSAYYGMRMITGPGEPLYVDYWIDKEEFLIWQLKK